MNTFLVLSAVLAGLIAVTSAVEVPVFAQGVYTTTAPESTPIGTSLLTVLATDADAPGTPSGTITYTLTDDNLAVDSSTGVITTTGALDYEKASRISLTVTAADGDGNEANTLLVVTLTDVNDNAPVFTQEYSLPVESVDGSLSTMTPVTIVAIDLDSGANSQLTYSIISGNSGNNFAIDANTGVLSLVSPVDAAANSFANINLGIRATDQGTPPLSKDANVVLEVTNKVTQQTFVCDRKWMVQRNDGSDGKCYMLVRGRKPWQHAQDYCRWLGVKSGLEPGNLVTVGDSGKQDWIVNNLMSQRISVWTGLNDLTTEGSMTWVDGTNYNTVNDYSNWAVLNGVQQPAGGTTKNCVAIEGNIRDRGAFLGKWNDFKCTMKTWSVCEFPAAVSTSSG